VRRWIVTIFTLSAVLIALSIFGHEGEDRLASPKSFALFGNSTLQVGEYRDVKQITVTPPQNIAQGIKENGKSTGVYIEAERYAGGDEWVYTVHGTSQAFRAVAHDNAQHTCFNCHRMRAGSRNVFVTRYPLLSQ
jgi:hypothetical protein